MNKSIATTKPDTDNDSTFFDHNENLDDALNFATNSAPKKLGRPFKNGKGKQPVAFRENFDVSESVRREVNVFIAQSTRFESKKEFYLQCVKDGLKKYKEKE